MILTMHSRAVGVLSLILYLLKNRNKNLYLQYANSLQKLIKRYNIAGVKNLMLLRKYVHGRIFTLGLLNVMMVINGIMLRLIVSVNPHQEQFPGKVKISANFLRLIQIRVPEQLIVTVMQYLKEQMILVL